MAFRALLFSKSPETNAAMTAACETNGIRAEVCSDIFTAIEKVKTRQYSCLIPDWSDQPEASFLLKRARESESNRDTVAIAIVDHEPTAADMRDNRLGYLVYRPISVEEADAVLAKSLEQMQPSNAPDELETPRAVNTAAEASSTSSDSAEVSNPSAEPSSSSVESDPEADSAGGTTFDEGAEGRCRTIGFREVCAVVLVLTAVLCFWSSRVAFIYLARAPEGKIRVLRESFAALFYMNQSAPPVSSAGSDAQQDAYFSRGPARASTQEPSIGVVATESTVPEARLPLPQASDFPLPTPVVEHIEAPPVHRERVAIPESMRNSPPIAPPVIVTVNPAQMMPVSAPHPQPMAQQFSEPIELSEEAARARLIHTIEPVYPSEGKAQKLHGTVVLRAMVARDGSVQDLKIVRGYFILGRAAIEAVKQWKFQPYIYDGHAVSTQTVITVNFDYSPG